MSADSDATRNFQGTRDLPNLMRDINSDIYRNPGRVLDLDAILKRVVVDFIYNYKTVITVVGNALLVFVVTLYLTHSLSQSCLEPDPGVYLHESSMFCNPFTPVERVVVEVDLDPHTHCYSSKSCINLAHSLSEQRRSYSFIIGAYGFVYVQLGFQCTLEHDGFPTLKIRLPVESIYNGRDFMAARKAVGKFTEILREGLECGMVLHNYTLTAEGCGQWNSWCTRVLQEVLTEDTPGRVPGPRRVFYEQDVRNTEFNPFDINRVYNNQYQIRVCGHR